MTAGELEDLPGKTQMQNQMVAMAATPADAAGSRGRTEPSIDRRSLKMELFAAAKDETRMKGALREMMEISRAEFCCYYSETGESILHVMLDSRELSHRVPEIHERLRSAYKMFSNDLEGSEGMSREKVYYKSDSRNMTYLVGNSRIESFFLVPVTFDSAVRGVLFFGSVRENAFTREMIRIFDGMAEDEEVRNPLLYMLGGETAILRETLGQFPGACALVSRDGRIIYGNRALSQVLRIEGALPEDPDEIRRVSPFNLGGVWNEFRSLGRTLTGRILAASNGTSGTLMVDWIRLERVSREIGSVVLIRDISEVETREDDMEDLLATVAHELRTPMTALKNSLSIMLDEPAAQGAGPLHEGDLQTAGRTGFIKTALRTLDRLNMLVNGLVDASSLKLKDRMARPDMVNTREFIEDAIILFRNSMYRKNIDLNIEIDPCARGIFIDRDMMEQVLQNLVSNSLKHVPGGGAISIEAIPAGTIPGDVPASLVKRVVDGLAFVDLRVSDSGPGLPDGVIEMINESGRKARGSLHGLGLYIADRLVGLHGGRMAARRNDGGGGCVDLYLAADRGTGEAMITLSAAGRVVDELVDRGYSPALFVFGKDGGVCWLDLLSGWAVRPVVYPDFGEIDGRGFYFWPVNENCALAVRGNMGGADDPLFFRKGTRGRLRLVDDGEEG
ncbi:MAG: GAF domain-containing sensor histidine kinase, partial [Candidatus Krumholzibacteria bacterium]|nr:GAF domain-containing sensor histidine kinase [Candidatus Krumholzibacteria bacterium]